MFFLTSPDQFSEGQTTEVPVTKYPNATGGKINIFQAQPMK
jgi:hypothetical protein